jgi:hypothetical protein
MQNDYQGVSSATKGIMLIGLFLNSFKPPLAAAQCQRSTPLADTTQYVGRTTIRQVW